MDSKNPQDLDKNQEPIVVAVAVQGSQRTLKVQAVGSDSIRKLKARVFIQEDFEQSSLSFYLNGTLLNDSQRLCEIAQSAASLELTMSVSSGGATPGGEAP